MLSKRQETLFNSFLAGVISLITLLVYLPCLRNEFVNWDDNVYVYENPYIRSFNTTLFKGAFFDFYASNWHPLTWISHALDYAVWGLNPIGHHLTNVILHTVNTFIVVVLATRLVEGWKKKLEIEPSVFLDDRAIFITGGVTGLLFGLHPVHVESVAWVAERKDLLCALFFLLSIMSYTRYLSVIVQTQSRSLFFNKQYLFTLGLFILALLSKPMAVTLPVVLLILDWHPFKRIQSMKSFWPAFIEKLPFIALSLISAILTIMAQKASMHLMEFVPLSSRILVAAKSLIAYLWKIILPLNLMPYYPYPEKVSLFSLEYLSAIVLAVVITVVCVVMVKKHKLWLSSWIYYVVTLIPVLGFVQVGTQAMADRYTYLPCLAPFLAIGLSAAWFVRKMNTLKRRSFIFRIFLNVFAIFVLCFTIYLTIKQIGIWKDSIDLWSYVIRKNPKILYAYNNRADAYEKKGMFDQAMSDYNIAIELNPNIYQSYYNRGNVFHRMGQFDQAISNYNIAIALNTSDASAYFNRGQTYLRKDNKGLAILDFQKACSLGSEVGCKALQTIWMQ